MALRLEKLSNTVWALFNDSDLIAEVDGQNNILRFNGSIKFGTDLINLSGAELAAINGLTKTAAELNALVGGVAGGYKIARGQATTGSASDTIVTGLATVVIAIANLESAPVLTCAFASAHIGNQAGAPAAGSILIKTWMPTVAIDATPIAATTFTKLVNWFAIGT
jgi:hypothetical protein